MKKEIPNDLAVMRQIPGTRYIILPDNRVASLLTPYVIHGKTFFNLIINDKYKRTAADKLHTLFEPAADEQPSANDHA